MALGILETTEGIELQGCCVKDSVCEHLEGRLQERKKSPYKVKRKKNPQNSASDRLRRASSGAGG